MNGGHLIVAYHGCDAVTRDDLVSGRLAQLDSSDNNYDWLGPGVYFFEDDVERARMFARAAAAEPGRLYTKRPICTPVAVAAVLCLRNVLDMQTQRGIIEFTNAYAALKEAYSVSSRRPPQNEKASPDDDDIILRRLDKEVFTLLHAMRNGTEGRDPLTPYDAVRSAFRQGKAVAPSSEVTQSAHIQIALRNHACVMGWALPPGDRLMTPVEYEAAKTLRDNTVLPKKRMKA